MCKMICNKGMFKRKNNYFHRFLCKGGGGPIRGKNEFFPIKSQKNKYVQNALKHDLRETVKKYPDENSIL